MPKTTRLNKMRATKRKTALMALNKKPLGKVKSIMGLRERLALIEEILGIGQQNT